MQKPVCVVAGVGPGNGAAFSRRFAAEGYSVAMLARSEEHIAPLAREIPGAVAYACDVADAERVRTVYAQIEAEMGPISTLVYNAGSGQFGTVDEVTPEAFESAWRVNALGLLLAGKAVIPNMHKNGGGSIVVIGATASLRGGARFAAFASAKAAQRHLAQSMARHVGQDGIHVALVIVDGVVDLPRVRKAMGDKPDDYFLKPDDIAQTVMHLVKQPRSAWSFEVDVRPFAERW